MAKAATSAALFDLLDRLREQFGHLRADLLLSDAFGLEILCYFAQDVIVAGLLEVGQHDFLGIGLGVRAAFAENARCPEPEHLVAASHRLEAKLLVMRKLLFEAFLALVECRHAAPRAASVKLHAYMQVSSPCISSADRQDNIGPPVCGENTEWKTWTRRDCAAPIDRLGCLSARTAGQDENSARISSPVPQPRILQSRTRRSHGNPMDFHKPRYTPMSRRRRIYEGKAKVLYEGPEPGTLIQHFKDDATAFNAKKHEVIEGKGVLNNRISEYVFQHLNDIGVPTHFIRRLNMREQLIREVEIIPLEVVVRNVAAGSLAQRLGIEEGTQLPRSIIEFYYKNDKLNDPMVSEEHITAFGWASPQEIDDIMALAIRVNDFLSGLFLGVGIRLVDFKMETGRLWENDVMRIVVADEISPDSCRLWDIKTNDKLDKDRFRRDLGGLVEAYTEVAKRLGIMGEGERPQGTGPVLVKS